jgi:hypothetical protein
LLLSHVRRRRQTGSTHRSECGCSRRLAAVVLPRHSCGGQRPKGYSSERLPYGQ